MRIATAPCTPTVLLVAASLAAVPLASGKTSHARGATQAEVQVALCSEPEQVVRALDLAPRGDVRETWLFDNAALTLFNRGLRIRLRATDAGSELTLKAAIDDCANAPRALIPAKSGKCEHDVHGDNVTAAVSLTSRLDASVVKALLSGRLLLADALSPAQARYLREAAKLWPLPADLRPLGPIKVSTYRAREKPYDVDISRLPAGERYVEASRKVALADADADAARKTFDDDLARSGVTVCTDQSAQAVNKLRALLRAP
jgi:hypothetical protein